MPGAPPRDHEAIYAAWLALGGATATRTETGVAPVVAAGVTAAVVHGIGDFFAGRFDFIVPARKGTRLPDVRLRVRRLTRDEVIPVGGIPSRHDARATAAPLPATCSSWRPRVRKDGTMAERDGAEHVKYGDWRSLKLAIKDTTKAWPSSVTETKKAHRSKRPLTESTRTRLQTPRSLQKAFPFRRTAAGRQ
jgi:hypothetical protein